MSKNIILGKIEKVRSQISELEDEKIWLQDSLLPPNELHSRVCDIVDDLGNRFNPNVNALDVCQ